MNIKFQNLSPFDSSFVLYGKDDIYIDKRFKNTDITDELIFHEIGHLRRAGRMDFFYDMRHGISAKTTWKILKQKPLSFFSPIIPIGYYWKGTKKEWVLSLTRLFTLMIIIFIVIIAMSI